MEVEKKLTIDFYITEVRYSANGTSIEHVKIRLRNQPITGEATLDPSRIVSSAFINDLLRTGKVVIYTAIYDKDRGLWNRGEEVICYDDYITTKSNLTGKDNLGELPEF